jgi:hypothetical protein
MKHAINTDKILTSSVRIDDGRQTDGILKLIKQEV